MLPQSTNKIAVESAVKAVVETILSYTMAPCNNIAEVQSILQYLLEWAKYATEKWTG